MKEYLFNQPKFHDRQVVTYKGQICLVLLVSQEPDIVHRDLGYITTIFSYILCDYFTHRDIWRPLDKDEDSQGWTGGGKDTRRITEESISELTENQKTQLVLTIL